MADFMYEGIDNQGAVVKGKVSGETESGAVEKLREMGVMVTELKSMESFMRPKGGSGSFFGFKKKVNTGELAMFSKQISAMLNAGIPVTRALYAIGQQNSNPMFKTALVDIAKNVESGKSVSEAFSMHGKIFDNLYVSMTSSGEMGGMLDESLTRLSEQLEKEKQLNDNIKSATFYPKMVGGFAVMVFVAMLLFMVPVFKGFVPDPDDVPGITKIIFVMSDSLRRSWYIWLLALMGIFVVVNLFAKSPMGKLMWEKIKFRIPAFGPIIHKTVLARFSRTLSTLINGGIPVIQALESAGPTAGSQLISDAVDETIKRIEEGKTIAEELGKSRLFPPMMIQMIAVGEETGSLSSMLDKMASFYEDEVSVLARGISAIIEPVMLIVVGLVIGLMVISLYLPIFSSITQAI